MKRQKTLASAISFEKYRKPTRRELFLAEMEQRVPWKELCALLEPFSPKAEGMSSHRVGENAPDSLSTELVQPQRQGRGRDPSATWNPCGASPVSISGATPFRTRPRFARSAIFWKPTSSQESLRGGKSFSRLPGLQALRGNQRARHDHPCSFAGENLREETRPGDAFHEEGNL